MIGHLRTTSGIFLSGTSVASLFATVITQSNITWVIGLVSGLCAVVMLYLSYRKHIREEVEAIEHKKVLEAQVEYLKKKTRLLGIGIDEDEDTLEIK